MELYIRKTTFFQKVINSSRGNLRQYWFWLVSPSPRITEPDQQRQASLLSSLLLGIIGFGSLMEVAMMALAADEDYIGYRVTIVVICLLVILYGISRTERIQLAAALAVILASLGIFLLSWTEPTGILGGLLNFLIVPLWLGSLYLSLPTLMSIILLDALALLAFPWIVSGIALSDILIGPFSFHVTTSVLLLVMTRHRNHLEQDRRAELAEKEAHSRREAARAKALLRVAEKLNVQLDLDTLLNIICKEASLALATPVAIVALHDPKEGRFHPVAGVGLPADLIRSLPPFSRNMKTDRFKEIGSFREIAELEQALEIPDLAMLKSLKLSSLAFADMEYEGDLIGSLVTITQSEDRDFTEEELLLLQGLARQAALAIINTRLLKSARREANRSQSLLRVAEHLNAQLDPDTLLTSICEEVSRALDAPISMLSLYDQKQDHFSPAAVIGVSPDIFRQTAPSPRAVYAQALQTLGTVFSVPDLQTLSHLPNFRWVQQLDLHAAAFTTIEYEGEIIGSLTTITPETDRVFTNDDLVLLQGLARQAALAITNTRLFKDAQRRLEHLQALRMIDLAIVSSRELRETLDVLLRQITRQLSVDAAVLLLMEESRQELVYGASLGVQDPTLPFIHLPVAEGIAGRAARDGEIMHIRNLQTNPDVLTYAPALAREGFVSYFAAPLVAQGKVLGVLEILSRSMPDPSAEWLSFLEALAGQAAIAIENTRLFDDLQRTNQELENAYDATIEGWSHALDLRDRETEGHTQRVIELTLELARTFGFSEAELVHIRRGGLLHDIGKMGVPDNILLKEGRLTEEEWEVMRRHPLFAQDMLLPVHYLRPALGIPLFHHERWDGSGYPYGLKEEEIPLTARIFAVVDVWDALTSDRPYRAAWSREKTLAHIRMRAGSHFDPQVVEAFVKLIERQGG